MKVVLAPVGTKMLEEGFIIQKSKIRDILSEGMLCSEKEIGLGDNSDGIIQLEENAKVGSSLSSLYPSEKIIDVEITPNRSDCLSIVCCSSAERYLFLGAVGPEKRAEFFARLRRGGINHSTPSSTRESD